MREMRALLGLAGPVVVFQVGLRTMGVADTIMVGRDLVRRRIDDDAF